MSLFFTCLPQQLKFLSHKTPAYAILDEQKYSLAKAFILVAVHQILSLEPSHRGSVLSESHKIVYIQLCTWVYVRLCFQAVQEISPLYARKVAATNAQPSRR